MKSAQQAAFGAAARQGVTLSPQPWHKSPAATKTTITTTSSCPPHKNRTWRVPAPVLLLLNSLTLPNHLFILSVPIPIGTLRTHNIK